MLGGERYPRDTSSGRDPAAMGRRDDGQALNRHQSALINVAYRITNDMETARDVVQDTYLTVLAAGDKFEGASSLKTYLYRIVINKCIDLRRRKTRWYATLEAFFRETVLFHQNTDEDMDNRELVRLLFKEIPDAFRVPLILAEADGMSYEEIAETLGVSLNTVRTRIFRCREKLREAFKKNRRLL